MEVMNPPTLLGYATCLIALMATAVFGNTNQSVVSGAGYSVKLHYEKEIALAPPTIQTLYSNALQLLETSNFNSRNSPASSWPGYGVTETQETYRQAVSGKYLLISFKEPRKVNTLGGEVSVKEIVIGLRRRDIASSLHTIDDEGRVVSHGKYSGPLCSMLMDLVKEIANSTN